MYEHLGKPLLSKELYYKRLFKHFLAAFSIIFFSLGIGVLGYHFFEGFNFVDSLLNASMILGGMGPVNELKTSAGKLFASFYALFSGIVFLVIVGVVFAPVFHRFLHKFHLETDDEKDK